MGNFGKKGISLALCCSIFFTSSAWAEGIFDNILSNATPAGVYKSGETGKAGVSVYTGGVFLRFGSAYDYPAPLFSITPPKVTFGCGGLSIKGMFMQLAGLDRLSEMLKNAGTSFAWGVVIGLVYSLPGVAKAFDFLNAWAKKIQQLLANACASGYALGASLMSASGYNGITDAISELTTFSFAQSAKKTGSELLDKWEKAQNEAFETIDKYFDENMVYKGFGKYSDPTTTEQKQALWTKLLEQKFVSNAYSVNFFMTILDHISSNEKRLKVVYDIFGEKNVADIKPFKVQKFAITGEKGIAAGKTNDIRVIGLPDILNYVDTKGAGGPLANNTFTFKSKVMRTGIVTAIMRHIGSETVLVNIANTERILKSVSDGTGTTNNLATQDAKTNVKCQTSSSSMCGSQFLPDGSASSQDIVKILNSLVQVLLYDSEATGAKDLSSQHLINALGYGIIALKSTQSNAKPDDRLFIVFALDKQETANIEFLSSDIKQKGLVTKSREIINAMIDGFSKTTNGVDTIDVADYETKYDINWVVPNVHQFIKVLQQSSAEDREDFVSKLAMFNAHALLSAIMDAYGTISTFNKNIVPAMYFSSGILDITRNKDGIVPINQTNLATFEANKNTRAALAELRKEYEKYLLTQDKATIDYNKLREELDRLDKKNKQRAIQSAPENVLN